MVQYDYMKSPIGRLLLAEENGAVIKVSLEAADETYTEEKTPLLQETEKQLKEYFAGKRRAFQIPIRFSGTPFREKVWEALQRIPYGETRSYGDIAREIGNPKACRAVGGANHDNCLLILVPCHRVIGAGGAMVGFGGGIPVKEFLLQLEKEHREASLSPQSRI